MYYKHVKKDSESLEPVWMGWRINIKFLQFFVNMYIFNSSPSQGKKITCHISKDNYAECELFSNEKYLFQVDDSFQNTKHIYILKDHLTIMKSVNVRDLFSAKKKVLYLQLNKRLS